MTFGGPHPEPLPTYYLGGAYNDQAGRPDARARLDEWRAAVRPPTAAVHPLRHPIGPMVIRHNGNIPDDLRRR